MGVRGDERRWRTFTLEAFTGNWKKGWFKSQNGSRILENDNEKHKKLQQSVYSVL